MLVLALVQAISGPVDPGTARRGCRPAAGLSEVVVCGRFGDSPYRLKPMPSRPTRTTIPAAAVELKGGGKVAVTAQPGNVGPIPTNRAMVTLAVPF